MPMLNTSSAALVLDRADALAACSEEPGRLTRRFATPALAAAGDLVLGWMRAAGMEVRRDAIGNVVGRWERTGGPPAGTLMLGSHLDTVVDAGRYDGMLGVLVALACVERLGDDLPFAVEVYAFADEEGVRYGTAYLGSSVVAGAFDAAALARRDADGVAMADAIRASGGDPAPTARARPAAPPIRRRWRARAATRPACSATSRSTSSRARCSRPTASRSAWSP